MVENAPDIVARFDRGHRHVYVNRTVERYTGISREKFLGKTNEELGMSADQVAFWNEARGTVFETGEPLEIEFAYDAPEGKRFFQSKLTPDFDEEGRVRTVTSWTREVSGSAKRLLGSIVDFLPAGVAIADDRGKLFYRNTECDRVMGTVGEALSMIADYGAHAEVEQPDGSPLDPERWPLATAIREERPVLGEELRIRRTDGRSIDVQVSAAPVWDAMGRVVAGICCFQDVTTARQREAAQKFLAQAGVLFSKVTNAGSVYEAIAGISVPTVADWCFIHALDEHGMPRVVAVGHVDPVMRRRAEEESRRCGLLRPETGVAAVLRGEGAILAPAITDGDLVAAAVDPANLDFLRSLGLRSAITVPLSSGERIFGALTFVAGSSRRVYGTDDLVMAEELANRASIALENARLYAALRESEERARTASEIAQEAVRRKDEFLAMLGHELRNPLAPIVIAIELMDLKGEEATSKERAMIARQVDHLRRLVDDLLDISRITRGKVDLSLGPIAVSDVVAKAVEMASPLLERHRHHLEIDIASDLTVLGDSVRLAQIVANLLTNAAKYTPPEGHVRVHAQRNGAEVAIRVKDDGIGMARELLGSVFELFVQGTRGLDRSEGGLGIGLTLVKNLVELHGGRVEAFSDGPGCGSEFVIQLPTATGHELPSRSEPRAERRWTSVRSLDVLVVDDNEDAAESLKSMLEAFGHRVRTCSDPVAALDVIASYRPSVALLDIGLPVMDGYELARRMRASGHLGEARLVAVTGYGLESDRERSRAAGFDVHLVKPVDSQRLRALLEEWAK